jgi:pyruvate formate lyase activating enzyme
MSLVLFTASGCARCNIAKKYLQANRIAYEEHDAVGAGKERFGQFYRRHRSEVVRGSRGIEFPVLVDGDAIRQGVAAALAYLQAGTALDGFIGKSEPAAGWVGGICLSAGDPAALRELEALLVFLKRSGLKIGLESDGRNASVLEHLRGVGIGDRVVMDIKGPQALYGTLAGCAIDPAQIGRSMAAAAAYADRRFETRVSPVADAAAGLRYLTPDEIAQTACWLKEATGSSRQPYFLRWFDPAACGDERLAAVDPLPREALFRYRTAARRHQVLTEIAADTAAAP